MYPVKGREGFHWQLIRVFSPHWHMVPVKVADNNVRSLSKCRENLFPYPESRSNLYRVGNSPERRRASATPGSIRTVLSPVFTRQASDLAPKDSHPSMSICICFSMLEGIKVLLIGAFTEEKSFVDLFLRHINLHIFTLFRKDTLWKTSVRSE